MSWSRFLSLFGSFVVLAAAADQPRGKACDFDNYWPQWRGPQANGVSPHASPPVHWSETNNVRWKITIPGLAHSSPVSWGDRIYVTTAVSADPNSVLQYPLKGELDRRTDVSKHQFRVLAIDSANGKVVWDKLAYEGEPKVARAHGRLGPISRGPRVLGRRQEPLRDRRSRRAARAVPHRRPERPGHHDRRLGLALVSHAAARRERRVPAQHARAARRAVRAPQRTRLDRACAHASQRPTP